LNFFESKEHKVIPSASLIPAGDPTLLLTSAGMVQFKPYFLGEATPPNPRLTSCQKCFRTTDIESVGDSTHLTFFEMLGNFSIGDYFKKESIGWAWEFVTQWLKLPPERLWISIFLDDEESFAYWRQLDIPEEKIVRFGEEDNFWGPAGDSGPCGPCSEIYYDFGKEIGCRQASCAPGCDCGRFSEIWNLVFTQYNQDQDGNRTLLPKPNIDTGMGLERVAVALQGKTSIYETDLFIPLIDCISGMAGKPYGAGHETDHAMRVITEHGRGITFLIGDGVMPGNEGRGYVLRRLLRRAALFGKTLGLNDMFLAEIARITIKQMEHVYPEIRQREDFILKVIGLEEARFGETLNTGIELLDQIMKKAVDKEKTRISGRDTFRLYDTYGFPVELTIEVASARGLSVDMGGFEKEMEKQRERAKASHKFELAANELAGLSNSLGLEETVFTGYGGLVNTTGILTILVDNEPVSTVEAGQQASLILEATPFYGEMGGQLGDTGEISGTSGQFSVKDSLRIPPDITVHRGIVTQGSLSVGEKVEAEVDRERRLDIARNHTATHLLQAALRQVLGDHVQQRGSLVAPDQMRFDFSHLAAMTTDEIEQVNRIVNERIRQDLIVYDEEIPYRKAMEEGVIALFDEKYGEMVRVLRIGKPVLSAELCGGTHVTTTGEIGFFRIISEGSIGAGLRRIEAVTGRGAEAFVGKFFSQWQEIAQMVGASLENVGEKVAGISSELDAEHKRAQALERELSTKKAESLLDEKEVKIHGEIKILAKRVDPTGIDNLREMSDFLKDRLGNAIVVLGTVWEDKPAFVANVAPGLVAEGYNAGEIIRKVAAVAGGSGGGKATLAQGGGKDKDKLDEALKLVESLI